jgi:hypothetical protein
VADWDVVGAAPAQVQNPWAVRSLAPAPAPTNASVGGKETTEGPVGFANGLAELVGKGLGNVPMAAVHGVMDLLSRASGHGAQSSTPTFPLSPNAQSVAQGVSDTLGAAAAPYQNPAVDAVANTDFVKNYVAPVAHDVAAAAPVAAVAARPLSALSDAVGPMSVEAAGPAAATPAGQLGLRTAENSPVARVVAGTSGRDALTRQNIAAGNAIAGAQAGVPHGTPVNPGTLADARVAPGELLDRAAAEVPTGPVSPNAAQMIQNADATAGRITKGTPNAVAQIQDIKARLLDPDAQFTGPQIRAEATGLRFDGNAGINAADPDVRQVSQFKRNVADALDQHVEDTLPDNSSTSLAQVKLARQTLAKNYTVQDLLGPGNDVDLQKLAQLYRDNPGLLTGDLRKLADFASKHPEVSALPSPTARYAPPGVLKDIAKITPTELASFVRPLLGHAARRSLTGDPAAAAAAARSAPVAGLGGEFGPLNQNPTAPEGPSEAIGGQAAPSPGGITATPITQSLGDLMPGQRGALGAPTDIGGLRQLMRNPRTYTGMKPEDIAALEDALKKLGGQSRTYGGTPPLGESF